MEGLLPPLTCLTAKLGSEVEARPQLVPRTNIDRSGLRANLDCNQLTIHLSQGYRRL